MRIERNAGDHAGMLGRVGCWGRVATFSPVVESHISRTKMLPFRSVFRAAAMECPSGENASVFIPRSQGLPNAPSDCLSVRTAFPASKSQRTIPLVESTAITSPRGLNANGGRLLGILAIGLPSALL